MFLRLNLHTSQAGIVWREKLELKLNLNILFLLRERSEFSRVKKILGWGINQDLSPLDGIEVLLLLVALHHIRSGAVGRNYLPFREEEEDGCKKNVRGLNFFFFLKSGIYI